MYNCWAHRSERMLYSFRCFFRPVGLGCLGCLARTSSCETNVNPSSTERRVPRGAKKRWRLQLLRWRKRRCSTPPTLPTCTPYLTPNLDEATVPPSLQLSTRPPTGGKPAGSRRRPNRPATGYPDMCRADERLKVYCMTAAFSLRSRLILATDSVSEGSSSVVDPSRPRISPSDAARMSVWSRTKAANSS